MLQTKHLLQMKKRTTNVKVCDYMRGKLSRQNKCFPLDRLLLSGKVTLLGDVNVTLGIYVYIQIRARWEITCGARQLTFHPSSRLSSSWNQGAGMGRTVVVYTALPNKITLGYALLILITGKIFLAPQVNMEVS